MTDEFWIGALVGLSIGLLLQWLTKRSGDSYLITKAEAKFRTPLCVRGRFYYLVPESEYVDRFCRGLPTQSHHYEKKPCGECHLQDGETCDICGARNCEHSPCIREDDDGYIFAQCSRCMVVTTACKTGLVAMEKFHAGKVFECHRFIGKPAPMV